MQLSIKSCLDVKIKFTQHPTNANVIQIKGRPAKLLALKNYLIRYFLPQHRQSQRWVLRRHRVGLVHHIAQLGIEFYQ
jgi:hypothetical protein